MTGKCVDCGFLAYRAKRIGQDRFREHSGYVEVEQAVRDDPYAQEQIVSGDSNAWKPGEPFCTRAVADLSGEIATLVSTKGMQPNDAARTCFNRERSCGRWTKYVPGLDPQQVTYVNVRTLPADTNLADPTQTSPTWDNVYANVLKNWHAMFQKEGCRMVFS